MLTAKELYRIEHNYFLETKKTPGEILVANINFNPQVEINKIFIASGGGNTKAPFFGIWNELWSGDFFTIFYNYLEIFQISFIGIFILLVALFFPRSGRFTRFLNKLSFDYVVLVLLFNSYDSVFRAYNLNFTAQKLTVYQLSDLFSFFKKGDWVNTFNEHASLAQFDLFFTKLFIWFSLIALAITFYGLADRFFIANSYDIEFTLLVYLIYIGSIFLFLSHNLIEFVLALEVITLGSYGLAAYERKSKFSSYAGVQYFIIGSIPSGLLVFSLALMYKAWGTLAFSDIDVMLNQMYPSQVQSSIQLYANKIIEPAYGAFNGVLSKGEHIDYAALYFNDATFLPQMNIKKTIESDLYYWSSVNGIDYERIFGTYNYLKLNEHGGVLFYDSYNARTFVKDLKNPEKLANHLLDWYSLFGSSESLNTTINNSFIAEKKTEMLFALFLVVFNLFFKITAAPFNFWAPSVYGNAPVSSVTFLSIYSKLAVVFALIKALWTVFIHFQELFLGFFLLLGILSIIFGMAGAFSEKTTKRFFVYSSMGHVGYMVVALSLSTTSGFAAVFHYLFVYVVSSYLMWFVLVIMGRARNNLVHFGSLKNIDKWVATAFALLVFSMSGIPPLGGFFVKLDVLIALLETSQFYVNFLLLFFSVISFFYYLRLIKIIYFDERKDFVRDIYISEERLWMVIVLFLALLFYMFVIHRPLLIIERQSLLALLNN